MSRKEASQHRRSQFNLLAGRALCREGIQEIKQIDLLESAIDWRNHKVCAFLRFIDSPVFLRFGSQERAQTCPSR